MSEGIQYLKSLHTKLWKQSSDPDAETKFVWSTDVRLNQEEWIKVLDIVEEEDLPCTLRGGNPGLGGVSFCILSNDTFFDQDLICAVLDKQLVQRGEGRSHVSVAMEKFAPLIEHPRNQRRLRWCGLKTPRLDSDHYEY